ncbi:hypothetical protein ACFLV7_08680 [Chloroflexota bacterium]
MDKTINNVGPDDYDFPWCISENDAIFMAVQEPLFIFRDHKESFRLTTHLPLSVHIAETRKMFQKHKVPEKLVRKKIRDARSSYLKQSLYNNEFDRLINEFLGFYVRRG